MGDWVLIESDWNLKFAKVGDKVTKVTVLIESDWNLKILDGIRNTVSNAY